MPKNRIRYQSDDDNNYVNIAIRAETNQRYTIPRITINKSSNILDRTSDYYCSVIRFNIPSFYVPILIFQPQNSGSDAGIYNITLAYNGTEVTENLIYSNRGNGTGISTDDSYYYIYSFQQMVDMINAAFNTALAQLKIDFPVDALIQNANAPFMVYNPVTQLFGIYAANDTYNTDLGSGNYIEMYFNDPLWTLFGSFPSQRFNFTNNITTAAAVQILLRDHGDNLSQNPNGDTTDTTIYIYLSQEFATTYNWNPFKKIVITSSSLPINGESIKSTGNETINIITDFVPSTSATEFRSTYQYYPLSQYRLIDLISDRPLKNFDLAVSWQDADDNLIPILLPWNSSVEIKILFVRKSMYKNINKMDMEELNNEIINNGNKFIYLN